MQDLNGIKAMNIARAIATDHIKESADTYGKRRMRETYSPIIQDIPPAETAARRTPLYRQHPL